MDKTAELKKIIANLPETPGVYFFRDVTGTIIYIGKAKSLKKRVQSYFSRQLDAKTQHLVEKIADIEYQLTPSESAAEVLEAQRIKEYQPHYNIILKDDKSFPWVRISDERFPVISICRKKKALMNDNASYYGPYTDAVSLKNACKLIRSIFGFRSCKTLPKKACLYYRLHLCPAPCEGKISVERYRKLIDDIRLFLESKYTELIARLTENMKDAASKHYYEEAAKLRDQVGALAAFSQSPQSTAAVFELDELQSALGLNKLPERIETFDISNISGKEACGSMVSFWRGEADKNNYRRFRIKGVHRIDDYDMMREVVHRRYERLVREHKPLPDLILIDGGRGHLAAALGQLHGLGVSIPVASIAKEEENVYVPCREKPVRFKDNAPALQLIRRMRDEAHRFAVAYHHILRRKRIIGK